MFLKRYKKTGLYGQSFYLKNILVIILIVIGAPTTNTPINQSGTGQNMPTNKRTKDINDNTITILSSCILSTPRYTFL